MEVGRRKVVRKAGSIGSLKKGKLEDPHSIYVLKRNADPMYFFTLSINVIIIVAIVYAPTITYLTFPSLHTLLNMKPNVGTICMIMMSHKKLSQ